MRPMQSLEEGPPIALGLVQAGRPVAIRIGQRDEAHKAHFPDVEPRQQFQHALAALAAELADLAANAAVRNREAILGNLQPEQVALRLDKNFRGTDLLDRLYVRLLHEDERRDSPRRVPLHSRNYFCKATPVLSRTVIPDSQPCKTSRCLVEGQYPFQGV